MAQADFAGWASKNDVRCTDGTVIRDGCFSDQDGEKVPLIWMHNHDEIAQVLGHAIIHNVPGKGTRIDGYFNDTESGKQAREMIKNGDVDALSIWANHLSRNSRDRRDILHGQIKEVSLVIGGADPEARIDTVLAHGEESDEEAEIWGFGNLEFIHDDTKKDEDEGMDEDTKKNSPDEESGETVKDVFNTLTDKQKKAVAIIVGQILEEQKSKGSSDDVQSNSVKKDEEPEKKDEVKHADEPEKKEEDKDESGDDNETVKDVYDSLNDKQKKVVDFLVGKAIEDAKKDNKSEEEEDTVKHNVFEENGYNGTKSDVISHDDMVTLVKDMKRTGSMREAYNEDYENGTILAHDDTNGTAGQDYGIENVDYLFPDARVIDNRPQFITRNMDWVDGVLSGVHRTPFSRVKSVFANITEDEARAKGYIKGHLKKEEVFSLLKRTTTPQTIYKKQKMDKDDVDDITDFDVIVWLKAEMQMMLREEIARAILIGDGRLASDDDKIQEEHIRPVYNDEDLYTIKFPVEIPANASDDVKAKALFKAQLKARKLYKGSGNLTFYTTEDEITNALLLENGIGERMYKSEAEVATAMRVTKVTPVPVMEGLQIEVADANGTTKTKYDVAGIDVNLADYNVGTNGGAKTDFFDDFDLNYNQMLYLYETRLSGALVKPFSAITFYYKVVGQTASTPATGEDDG